MQERFESERRAWSALTRLIEAAEECRQLFDTAEAMYPEPLGRLIGAGCGCVPVLAAADDAIKAAWPSVYAPVGDATYAQKWERLRAARDRYARLRGLRQLTEETVKP